MAAIGLLAFAVALLVVLRAVYERHGAAQVRVSLTFAPVRTQRGERVDLLLRIEHVGILPLSWLTAKIDLPRDLSCQAAPEGHLEARLALPYRGGIVRHYAVVPEVRGLYHIRMVRVDFTDPLGLTSLRQEAEVSAQVLAHPHAAAADLATPTRSLIGEIERTALLEDPTAFRGVRPYQPGDPLRRMHWPQTARTGQLMAREYATAVDAKICLCLNIATHTPHWAGIDRPRLERVVEAAAGLAIEACRIALPVGLLVNGVAFTATPITRVPPGASATHLTQLLDVMARLAPYPSESPQALLRAASALSRETTLVLLTGSVPDVWRHELPAVAARRDVVLMVLAAPGEPVPVMPGVHVVSLPSIPARGGPQKVVSP